MGPRRVTLRQVNRRLDRAFARVPYPLAHALTLRGVRVYAFNIRRWVAVGRVQPWVNGRGGAVLDRQSIPDQQGRSAAAIRFATG